LEKKEAAGDSGDISMHLGVQIPLPALQLRAYFKLISAQNPIYDVVSLN